MIELFKFSNDSAHKLKKPNPNSFVVLATQLIGDAVLWNTFKYTQDDKAAFAISDFLAELYTSYEESKT